ncbi:MAG: polyamine aminopropyltransferase [Bradymonadia bacterium]
MNTSEPRLDGTRARRYGLGAVVMFLGGSGLVYEYCISTLATHLLGNSIEQFSVIIALMLFAMGVAGLAQKWIADESLVPTIFVVIELLLALIGGTSAVVLYIGFAWMEHFHLLLYSLALAIGFGIGLEIPLLLRINEQWRTQLSDNVGNVLSLDYVGALMGALIWAFVMLPAMSLDRISLYLGLANLGAALLTWVLLRPAIRHNRLLLILFLGVTTILIWVTAAAPRWKDEARQRLYAYPIQHTSHSPYQSIVVTGAGSRMSLYLNGRLQFDSEDEYIYHEYLVHPAMYAAHSRARVLILGGGDGLAVREVLRWPEVQEVLLVDLDPAVTNLAKTYSPLVTLNEGALLNRRVKTSHPSAHPGKQLTVYKAAERPRDALQGVKLPVAEVLTLNADADVFLQDVTGEWDVIIADFPDPSTPDLAKLYSAEFYGLIKQHLANNGIFVAQASSPYANRSAFWSIRDTIEAAGFHVKSLHAYVPTFGEWGWHVAKLAEPPSLDGFSAANLRHLDAPTLAASMFFPSHISRPAGPRRVSTRIDPWVMRLYQRGEPLTGRVFYPGQAGR